MDARLLMVTDLFGTVTGTVDLEDNVEHYQLTGDYIIAAGAKVNVSPSVRITNGVPGQRIIVQAGGELNANQSIFTGPQMEIIVESGGRANIEAGSKVEGLSLQYQAGSLGRLVDTQLTAKLEYYSPDVVIFGDRFTPGSTFPTYAPVTTTPSLVDRLYNSNQFDIPAEINLVGSTTNAAVLNPYANIARFVVAGDLNVPAGTSLTVPAGVELLTRNVNYDIFVDGTFNATSANLNGSTELRGQNGGELNITAGSSVTGGGHVFYGVGSLGTVANSTFDAVSEITLQSVDATLQNNTFAKAFEPIHSEGDLVPKIYNGNVFAPNTTIGVFGIVTKNVTWTDYADITTYELDADLTISSTGNLTINSVDPNVIELVTPIASSDITVFGIFTNHRVDFLGATELIAKEGAVLSLDDVYIEGGRILLETGSAATLAASFINLPLELYTHTATIEDNQFLLPAVAPSPPLPVLTYPSLVPLLYDEVGAVNNFLPNTAIRVTGTADTDATWKVYPDIASYWIVDEVVIAADVTVQTQAGVEIRMNEVNDVINVDGTLTSRDTTYIGLQTELVARDGGTLNLLDDSSVPLVTTTVLDGTVNYQPGSEGLIRDAHLDNSVLFNFSAGLQVEGTTFSNADPVYILPSLVPDLYDNTFVLPATIRVQGATAINSHWQAYLNIAAYELSDDIIVSPGTELKLGDLANSIDVVSLNTNFDVLVDGKLTAINTRFLGVSTEIIARSNPNPALPSGDLNLLDGTQVNGNRIQYQVRSTGVVRCSSINTVLNVVAASAAATSSLPRMVFNNFTNGSLVLSGPADVLYDADDQFWGTAFQTQSQIETKILHRNDDPSLPTVDYVPFLANMPDCSNFRPNLSSIPDQSVAMNAQVGPLDFLVSDSDSPVEQLIVTARSSNSVLIPDDNIFISGTGTDRQITLTPANDESGVTTITVRAEDPDGFFSEIVFQVTVLAPNVPPVAAPLPDVFIGEDQPLEGLNAIPLFFTDETTPVDQLTVSIDSSSNPDLLPEGMQSVSFDALTGVWRLEIVPAPDQFTPLTQTLPDTLTLAVSDGQDTTYQTVNIRVAPINDPPRITLTNLRAAPGVLGAVIGELLIDDPDPNDLVTISLNNPALELVGTTLKLTDTTQWASGDTQLLTVEAQDDSGAVNNLSREFYQLYASAVAPLVRVEMKAIDSLGFPLDFVRPGDVFYVQGVITDLRPGAAAEGVNRAYVIAGGDGANWPITAGSYVPGPLFPNMQAGSTDPTFAILVGGAINPLLPATGSQELFRFQVTAPAAGGPDLITYNLIAGSVLTPRETYLVSGAGVQLVNDDEFELRALSVSVIDAVDSPLIDVSGNGNSIPNSFLGAPNVADGTDFGSEDVATGSVTNTFTIDNLGVPNLNLFGNGPVFVSISGPAANDFTVTTQPASSIIGGGSSGFAITFDPQGVGLRQAVVTIWNDTDGENPFQFAIQGTSTETNSGPTDILLSDTAVQGGVQGAIVADVTVVDPNIVDNFLFTLSDSRFEVINGRLKLKAGIALDAIAEPTVPLTITAEDQGALTVTRSFTISVQPPVIVLKVTMQAFKSDGVTPLTQLEPYQDFIIRAFVEDERTTPQGVKSAYFDISFDPTRAIPDPTGAVEFGDDFPNLRFVGYQLTGTLDEAGGATALAPLGGGSFELLEARFRAGVSGNLTFTPTLAGNHLTTLVGLASPLQPAQIEFVPLNIPIAVPQYPWHNPNIAADVDLNGVIDVQDIAYTLFYFGRIDLGGTAPNPAAPLFLDVVPDGGLDAQDILQTTFDWRAATGGGEGERTSAAAAPEESNPFAESGDPADAVSDDLLAALAQDLVANRKKKS